MRAVPEFMVLQAVSVLNDHHRQRPLNPQWIGHSDDRDLGNGRMPLNELLEIDVGQAAHLILWFSPITPAGVPVTAAVTAATR